jgi:hypothetical protein
VAADTLLDDPRTYRVYLAWFGPGMVKVGITREERDAARLREQGAVAFTWLGRGPLMAARRTEEVLRTALGVPDRIPYVRKRVVRGRLPGVEERFAEVAELYGRAAELEGHGWPESLERVPPDVVDHGGIFGLDRSAAATRSVSELVDGGVVAGRLVAAAGPDLHLAVGGAGGVVVLDTRLITGWELAAVDPTAAHDVRVPLIDIGGGGVQGGLF